MTIYKSDMASGRKSTVYPFQANAPTQVAVNFNVPPEGLKVGDIVEMTLLPAGCTVVDAVLAVDKSDSNAAQTLSLDVGVMSGEWQDSNPARSCGSELFDNDTTARSGGTTRMSLVSGFRLQKQPVNRSIGIKVEAAAATLVPGAVWTLVLTISA